MIRYAAIPQRAWMNDYYETLSSRPSETVLEDDPTPKATGLLDANGVPLYRLPDRIPLGFDLTGVGVRFTTRREGA